MYDIILAYLNRLLIDFRCSTASTEHGTSASACITQNISDYQYCARKRAKITLY